MSRKERMRFAKQEDQMEGEKELTGRCKAKEVSYIQRFASGTEILIIKW